MNIRFTSAARRELAEAVEYYERTQSGLGNRFLRAVEACAERIERYPHMWAKVSPRLRRCLVHRFPFALFYRSGDDEILIVAVADLRRDPTRWEDLL